MEGSNKKTATTRFPAAANKQNIETIRELIRRCPENINQVDEYGETALMIAAWNGYSSVAELLLTCKLIDVNLQNKIGWNALYFSSKHANFNCFKLLLLHPFTDVNACTVSGNTSLLQSLNLPIK